jgi:hypothetical protein
MSNYANPVPRQTGRSDAEVVSRAYIVGASKERLATIRERLRRDGFDVCGHCDRPREFCPPRDASLMLLITDMGCHATLQKAREYCRLTGIPCVGGVWRSWSTTRERLSALTRAARGTTACAANCPLQGCCGRPAAGSAARAEAKAKAKAPADR